MPTTRRGVSARAAAETTVDRVAASVRADILSGVLPPGAPLREEAAAEQHGVSRHTVRAAFQRLVAERLAVAEAYRGVRVASFDRAHVIALQQLRAALEVEAVRIAGERLGDAWPDEVLAPARAALDRLDVLARTARDAARHEHDAERHAHDAARDAERHSHDAARDSERQRDTVASEATDSLPPTRQRSSDGGGGGIGGSDGGDDGGGGSDGGGGGRDEGWLEVERIHADFHRAIVAASASPRIIEAHVALGSELLLFLLHVRPHYTLESLIAEHRALLDEVQHRGPAAMREHLEHSTRLLVGG
ncbi:GntR family transcriptional regulator [Agromyces badenianii]|uniref:GntR family transcriptional regulator n=1 Tax=Agromyces badenianii TaxID=2080742 RepID=UPI00143CDA4A|nr:GntR family transcriptional regulator [Agromyces badenianii]